MVARVRVPGSCGELVQGVIDGIDFHVTCPINRFSEASAVALRTGELVLPNGLDKSAGAVRLALKDCGASPGVRIDIQSELPRGKGMASSTADIASAVLAACRALELAMLPDELAAVALSIEPTDGVFFEGIVVYDHRRGRRFERVGTAPPLEIIVLEPPETVDTLAFNRYKPEPSLADERIVVEALDMAVCALRSRDVKLLGEAATLSALLNQKLLPKSALGDVIDACRRNGGVGVNVAHSGSVMGMMVEAGYGQRLFERISHLIPRAWGACVVELVDGGPRYVEDRPLIVTA